MEDIICSTLLASCLSFALCFMSSKINKEGTCLTTSNRPLPSVFCSNQTVLRIKPLTETTLELGVSWFLLRQSIPCINKNLVSTTWIMVSSLWKIFNSRKGDCFQQQQNSFYYTENISLKAMCAIRKVVFALQNMTLVDGKLFLQVEKGFH